MIEHKIRNVSDEVCITCPFNWEDECTAYSMAHSHEQQIKRAGKNPSCIPNVQFIKFYKEYPEIEIPYYLQSTGWEDSSWHNDVTASSRKNLPNKTCVVVWVYHKDTAKRESYQYTHQFVVMGETEDGDLLEFPVFETDDASELSILVSKMVDVLSPRVAKKVTQKEFVQAMTTPGLDRPRGKDVHLNQVVDGQWVDWDCPVCKTHNHQKWLGREYHICTKCEQPTELK